MNAVDPIVAVYRAERDRRGVSAAMVGLRLGVSPNAVTMWENGYRQPSLARLRPWGAVFDLELAALPTGPSDSADVWREYEVVVPSSRGVGPISCATVAEAVAINAAMPGSQIRTRTVRAQRWTSPGGDAQ